MKTNTLQIPSFLHEGEKSIESLDSIMSKYEAKSVALITDKQLMNLGLCDQAIEIIERKQITLHVFDEVVPEPSVDDVLHIVNQVSPTSVDLILAIGGGSTMDTAKLVSVLIKAKYTIYDLLNDASIAQKMVPTIMVPTTCGTGSEATCNAIVALPEENSKKGIVNGAFIPNEVILDVQLIAHLPRNIIAATGVDALAHCVECYTSNKATPLSNTYALAGAQLIFANIVKAYKDPQDLAAKRAMMLAAFYGGVAITGSGTTAVHALSYPLGGKFHIAHGVSNAILFTAVMEFNRDACQTQLAQICDAIQPDMCQESEGAKSEFVVRAIASIVRETEIPVNLNDFGVKKSDLAFLVNAGFQQQRLLVNNPKKLSVEDIQSIYQKVL